MSDLPTPQPYITPETEEFWKATTEEELLICQCNGCDDIYFYPRQRCPHCSSMDTKYIESSGKGEVYARSVVHQAAAEYSEVTPFILAYVELDEGLRMMTNIVDTNPDDVEIGDKVEVVFDEVDENAALPRFRPV